MMQAALLKDIATATGIELRPDAWAAASGGDVSRAGRVTDKKGGDWFLKRLPTAHGRVLQAEAAGLEELASAAVLRVPVVKGCGLAGTDSWLLLEYLPLASAVQADALLGTGLARLHRVTSPAFGWRCDNFIGLSEQPNCPGENWPEFFAIQRIGTQLRLAADNGAPAAFVADAEALQRRIGDWFVDYRPEASLLHGDLWSGNRGALPDGQPVIFDPAVYYGDRETDLAMTRLFGGFSAGFYTAYEDTWPLDCGAGRRELLYNLYHVMNHFNLFGAGYLEQAQSMLATLLRS